MNTFDYACSCLMGQISKKNLISIMKSTIFNTIKDKSSSKYGKLSDKYIRNIIPEMIFSERK